MLVLSIDTCEGFCSAAVVDVCDETGIRALASKSENLGRGHAERLLPMIEELLQAADKKYENLDRIAVVAGPGTFTGLRIGLSVARGLALALSVPAVGVSSLQALAASAKMSGTVHAILKGRGGQVFAQSFTCAEKDAFGTACTVPLSLGKPVNEDLSRVIDDTVPQGGHWIGSGLVGAGDLGAGINPEQISDVKAVCPIALACVGASLNPGENPAEPSYLREADAVRGKAVFEIAESR
ncbi:tRNA (adenosine(37)-N6)-threonylcarbamoyltransferase complex dimerization subunit type 1 TsaB [Kordiimonas sediminis]|uniref:tRNA (Adenosine(37)-N6)-threonylcarbamoyltransferase complex dimerization subunit type 1 TsaB n=1 Tax=Kordiimonas sediminis TaxID=1735581 RepID=A0A919E658_9PROT|nr:tRNA (adenosine(37)-N6)-threonylcarbamoyltransferase complex dimerization subunit type 1 TsaB [Kordiimonas sediminis]GHF16224.1 tRNA (adenosine(37)-N6)-threonylcarbamoyltransferase complex dimerization subunit type 1 TsaB [Kordiimonas sediminis]